MIILQFIQISLIANHKDSFTDSPNEIVKKIWIFSNVQFNRFAMGEELCQSLGCVGYRLFIFILNFLCLKIALNIIIELFLYNKSNN